MSPPQSYCEQYFVSPQCLSAWCRECCRKPDRHLGETTKVSRDVSSLSVRSASGESVSDHSWRSELGEQKRDKECVAGEWRSGEGGRTQNGTTAFIMLKKKKKRAGSVNSASFDCFLLGDLREWQSEKKWKVLGPKVSIICVAVIIFQHHFSFQDPERVCSYKRCQIELLVTSMRVRIEPSCSPSTSEKLWHYWVRWCSA